MGSSDPGGTRKYNQIAPQSRDEQSMGQARWGRQWQEGLSFSGISQIVTCVKSSLE
jgi:hypothetical protein